MKHYYSLVANRFDSSDVTMVPLNVKLNAQESLDGPFCVVSEYEDNPAHVGEASGRPWCQPRPS